MKKLACFIMVSVFAMPLVAGAEEPVFFPHAKLKAVVEASLGISSPTPTDMLGLTDLSANGKGILDLTGLETAINIETLKLTSNGISDLSPLSDLTNLSLLYLTTNQISDLSPLSGLTNLTKLWLGVNQISDLLPLASLTNLTVVNVRNNPLSTDAHCNSVAHIISNNPGIRFSLDANVNPLSADCSFALAS